MLLGISLILLFSDCFNFFTNYSFLFLFLFLFIQIFFFFVFFVLVGSYYFKSDSIIERRNRLSRILPVLIPLSIFPVLIKENIKSNCCIHIIILTLRRKASITSITGGLLAMKLNESNYRFKR